MYPNITISMCDQYKSVGEIAYIFLHARSLKLGGCLTHAAHLRSDAKVSTVKVKCSPTKTVAFCSMGKSPHCFNFLNLNKIYIQILSHSARI